MKKAEELIMVELEELKKSKEKSEIEAASKIKSAEAERTSVEESTGALVEKVKSLRNEIDLAYKLLAEQKTACEYIETNSAKEIKALKTELKEQKKIFELTKQQYDEQICTMSARNETEKANAVIANNETFKNINQRAEENLRSAIRQ